jgi:hypothetical protein
MVLVSHLEAKDPLQSSYVLVSSTCSRLLILRSFNKILRHLFSVFDDGQGPTNHPWSHVVVEDVFMVLEPKKLCLGLEVVVSLPQPWSRA